MSASELPTLGTGETYQEKFVRKFKQQPLVPIGAALTTVTLTVAMVRMRQGKSKSMNHWLRARVVAQGLTVAAIVVGSYMIGERKEAKEEQTAREQDAFIERAAFEARMRAAEEAHRVETGLANVVVPVPIKKESSGSGWWRWLGLSGGQKKAETKSEATAATVVAPPAVVGSPPLPAPPAKEEPEKNNSS